MNQKDFDNLGTEQNTKDQSTVEPDQPEETDPVAILSSELKQIRQALGLGSDAGSSSLMKRLDAIETKLSKPQEQRNLPATITREQASSRQFLIRSGITLEDISSGRVSVDFNS
jgi:hypothetical protein